MSALAGEVLLAILAVAVVALLVVVGIVIRRNALLIADLRQLNQNTESVNNSLTAAKDQVERLDSVKTDFITIASHELRTPLAQIRGYTEIIDELNEEGLLDQDQMAGMVSSLRRAGERMEELITAMLDVSQIDVNAMNLHFAELDCRERHAHGNRAADRSHPRAPDYALGARLARTAHRSGGHAAVGAGVPQRDRQCRQVHP